MRILFTICGRAGSKGIRNKNIQKFLGIPLPLYTLSIIDLYLSRYSQVEYDIVLNTDSNELIEIINKNSKRKVSVIKREAELAGDDIAKCNVIRNCYKTMKQQKGYDYDEVIDLDITSPIRRIKDLEAVINKMAKAECDIVETVTESRRSPYFNMVRQTEFGVKTIIEAHFATRQEAPITYDENASMCAYGIKFLNGNLEWDDSHREVVLMPDVGVLDLDKPQDLELMQVIAEYLLTKDNDFKEVFENIAQLN